ncbi:MAG TPA: hypothetical protein VJK03_04535 [Candidatus Nanoarchaeia archaeon]|nr:hypothetical protein [Candidatus Nanoarchaeia archaeon]
MENRSPQEVTLDLLVRSGNPGAVKSFTAQYPVPESKKEEKTTEANIYAAIKIMREEAEGGIDSEPACTFFNRPRISSYFSTTKNISLLEEIVEVLSAGTNASMEAYAQITAIDVLGVPALEQALRNNLHVPTLQSKVKQLVSAGYELVFCPNNIDADAVNHYFPIVHRWKDLIEPNETAEKAIETIADDIENLLEYDYSREFLYAALPKLAELTDAQTVAQLAHNYIKKVSEDSYKRLIDEKKVLPYERKEGQNTTEQDVLRAVTAYERNHYLRKDEVATLAKALKGRGKEYLADKIGEWFRKGQMIHIAKVVEHDILLYDLQRAQNAVAERITLAYGENNLALLERGLQLPQKLIDAHNPGAEMQFFAVAYNISHKNQDNVSD